MVSPRIGQGTHLELKTSVDPDPEVWQSVARLTEIGEFGGDADDIDISNHDQPEAVREYIRGLAEPGEISVTGIWIADATQLDLHAKVFAGLVPNETWRVVLPADMGISVFEGFVAGFRLNPQLDGRIEFTGRIKLSGSFTLVLPP